jgi:hypothetical protein
MSGGAATEAAVVGGALVGSLTGSSAIAGGPSSTLKLESAVQTMLVAEEARNLLVARLKAGCERAKRALEGRGA